jgi:hypothetical protein
VGNTRRLGLNNNHWRCRYCSARFVVGSLLADHITEHEKYGLKLET